MKSIVRDQSLRLKHDLGKWKVAEKKCWTWYYDSTDERKYGREGSVWRIWVCQSTGRRQNAARYKRTDEMVDSVSLGANAIAVTAIDRITIKLLGLVEFEQEDEPTVSIEASVKRAVGCDSWVLSDYFCENWDIVAEAVKGFQWTLNCFCFTLSWSQWNLMMSIARDLCCLHVLLAILFAVELSV